MMGAEEIMTHWKEAGADENMEMVHMMEAGNGEWDLTHDVSC